MPALLVKGTSANSMRLCGGILTIHRKGAEIWRQAEIPLE